MRIDFPKLLTSLAIPFIAAVVGSVFTSPSIPVWYASLNKPAWTPANNVFGPVWTTLFILMGLSLYLVWDSRDSICGRLMSFFRWKDYNGAITLFGIQLVLNALWSILFFGMQNPVLAFVEIIFLWAFIAATIVRFYRIDERAGLIMVPYIMWVSLAAYLNYSVWLLNL